MTRLNMRTVWALCVVASTVVTALGIQLYVGGAGAAASYPLVVLGIGMLPVCSALVERLSAALPD